MFFIIRCRGPLRSQFPEPLPMRQNGIDPGEPLFLTPYIERGDIAAGIVHMACALLSKHVEFRTLHFFLP